MNLHRAWKEIHPNQIYEDEDWIKQVTIFVLSVLGFFFNTIGHNKWKTLEPVTIQFIVCNPTKELKGTE